MKGHNFDLFLSFNYHIDMNFLNHYISIKSQIRCQFEFKFYLMEKSVQISFNMIKRQYIQQIPLKQRIPSNRDQLSNNNNQILKLSKFTLLTHEDEQNYSYENLLSSQRTIQNSFEKYKQEQKQNIALRSNIQQDKVKYTHQRSQANRKMYSKGLCVLSKQRNRNLIEQNRLLKVSQQKQNNKLQELRFFENLLQKQAYDLQQQIEALSKASVEPTTLLFSFKPELEQFDSDCIQFSKDYSSVQVKSCSSCQKINHKLKKIVSQTCGQQTNNQIQTKFRMF